MALTMYSLSCLLASCLAEDRFAFKLWMRGGRGPGWGLGAEEGSEREMCASLPRRCSSVVATVRKRSLG